MPMGSKIFTFIERTKTTDIYQNFGLRIPLTNSDWFGKCLCTGSPGSKEEAEKQALWIRPLDDAVSHWLSNWQKITSCGLKWIYSLSSTHPTRNCYNKTHSLWKINGFWWRIPIIPLSPLCLTSQAFRWPHLSDFISILIRSSTHIPLLPNKIIPGTLNWRNPLDISIPG